MATKKNTKKSNNSKTTKSKKPTAKAKGKQQANNEMSLKEWFRNLKPGETAKFIIGLVLICLSLFMMVAFISFIFTGKQDAVNLEIISGKSVGEIENISNSGGTMASVML